MSKINFIGVNFREKVGINLIEAPTRVSVTRINCVGEEREEVRDRGTGGGVAVGEENLGAVRVVPRTFLGIGEDFVSVDELLELGRGVGLRKAGLNELIRVALEGELFVG